VKKFEVEVSGRIESALKRGWL